MRRVVCPLFVCVLAVACGGRAAHRPPPHASEDAAVLSLDLAQTRPAGLSAAFRPPPALDPRAAAGLPLGSLRCVGHRPVTYGAHIELFAEDRGLVVPAGIGIAGSVRVGDARKRAGGTSATAGRCSYPLWTIDPTGVVEIARPPGGPAPSVGELFALWGEPLAAMRLGAFRGPVRAFLNGRRWSGDPRQIPLSRHAQVVLELGPFVEPHSSYLFRPGL